MVLSAFPALKTPFLFLFLLDWAQGCRAKVRYRSSNTPAQLSFAPEDSQIHEPWCRCSSLLHAGVKIFSLSGCLSILSSSTHGRLHETQWQNHYLLPTYHILFGQHTVTFFETVQDMSDPALCQDRVAICTRFSLFFKLASLILHLKRLMDF